MAKSNSTDAFQIQYKVLKATAAWPEENEPLRYKIKGTLSLISTCALGITMLIEAYNDLNNFAALSEVLYILITVMVYNVKNINFLVQKKTFVRMIKMLGDPSFSSYPEDLDHLMVERIRSSRFLTQCYMFFVLTCILMMSVAPLFEAQPLPFPFPYDLGAYTPLMYAFQVITVLTVAMNHLCYDSLAAGLIGIAITHLEILARRIALLNGLNDAPNEAAIVEGLRVCIKHHLTIIEFIEDIDRVFSICTFSQFMGSAIIICNSVFYFVLTSVGSSQFFMLINYIAVIFGQLFMYCWFGNEVIWKSTNVVEACYSSNWYDSSKPNNRYLFIIMERSKRPLRITASKISVLSLAAFTTIIKWSYSYFALLMKLYMKQKQGN